MLSLITRRFLATIPLLIVNSVVVFLLVSLGGDPLRRSRLPGVPESTLKAQAHAYGLDRPLAVRYLDWIGHAVRGDFGTTANGQEVGTVLAQRALVSLRLVVAALVISALLALVIGFISGVRSGGLLDRVLVGVAILLLTLPEFWTALVIKQGAINLNQAQNTTIFYTFGESTVGGGDGGLMATLTDYTAHMTLPTIVLVAAIYPVWFLYQRASTAEVMGREYMVYARAKGLAPGRVLIRHGLRTSLAPLITMIALRLPWIIGGLVVVETIFGWQGMGQLAVRAIQEQDINTVLAWVLIMSVFTILLNLIADIAYRILDPRIEHA